MVVFNRATFDGVFGLGQLVPLFLNFADIVRY